MCADKDKKGKQHLCGFCGKRFSYPSERDRHERIHTANKPYVCELCGKKFNKSWSLKQHMLRIHSEKEGKQSREDGGFDLCIQDHSQIAKPELKAVDIIQIKNGAIDPKPHCCETCGRGYIKRSHLVQHLKTHAQRKHGCQLCDKWFFSSSDLRRHVRSHTGERPYGCDTCGKKFGSRAIIVKHLAKGHPDSVIKREEKPHGCSCCGRRFSRRSDLNDHIFRHQDGGRKFDCTVCNKGFSSIRSFKRHTLTHAIEKPYACLLCGLGFTQSWHLKRHVKKWHNDPVLRDGANIVPRLDEHNAEIITVQCGLEHLLRPYSQAENINSDNAVCENEFLCSEQNRNFLVTEKHINEKIEEENTDKFNNNCDEHI